MSETGLLSGLYQQAHKYANLVDLVLVNLKTGSGSINDPARKELSSLLIQTADERSRDFSARFLLIALQSRSNISQLNLAQIGTNLLSQEQIGQDVIEKLEILAQALEEEETEAVARMRRWTR